MSVGAPLLSGAALAAGPMADSDDVALAEIVVTANKREENLDKVGATVAVLDGSALRELRIDNGEDLARYTPGLAFTTTNQNAPIYTLRGVGFYDNTIAAYPDVSLYLDQVPLSLPKMAVLTVFDLDRVETLKGPQGTLFGNNATGGAVNFIAAKPTKQFAAGAEVGYGRFNSVDFSGFVSGPLTDTLSARAAVKVAHSDGWQYNLTRTATLGKKDNVAGRVLLDWQPTEDLRVELNLNGWHYGDDPQAWQLQRLTIGNPPGSVGIFGNIVPADYPVTLLTPLPEGNARIADWSIGSSGWTQGSYTPMTDDNFKQATLRADWTLANTVTLTSLTGYSVLDMLENTDSDGTYLVTFEQADQTGHVHSFTQEFRIANRASDALRWVLGANYEHTGTGQWQRAISWDGTTTPAIGGSLVVDDNYQLLRNYAAFGNLEYDLTKMFTVKGGVRQSRAGRDSNAAGFTEPGIPQPVGTPHDYTYVFNYLYNLLYPGQVNTIQPGQSYVLDDIVGTPLYHKAARYYGTLNENSTSWNVGVDFKPADDWLLYANVKKGYKSGSFPLLAAAIWTGLLPVKQESLLDYEVGLKTSLADGRVSLNGAVFYYDYQNKQLLTKFVDPVFGSLDKLQNVPKSSTKGAELELRARPFRPVTVSAAVTYIDARVDEYQGVIGQVATPVGAAPVLASFKGAQLPFSSRWHYALHTDYEFPLSSRLSGFVGVGLSGQTSSYSTLAVTPQQLEDYRIAGYALVDASAGVRTTDGRWRLSAWGKNLGDKYYITNRIENYDTLTRSTGRPREYGVSVGYNY
jgi:outer membrane receptor protein involved in Fe transport